MRGRRITKCMVRAQHEAVQLASSCMHVCTSAYSCMQRSANFNKAQVLACRCNAVAATAGWFPYERLPGKQRYHEQVAVQLAAASASVTHHASNSCMLPHSHAAADFTLLTHILCNTAAA
jgi:hypothetical protein